MNKDFWEFLRSIATIPSLTFNEKEKSNFMLKVFSSQNLEVIQDEIWNLIAFKREIPNKIILIDAHLDTVFRPDTPLLWEEDENMIRCPSVADNSISLAVLGFLAKGIDRWPHVVLSASVREEGTSKEKGIKNIIEFLKKKGEVCFVICLEGIPLGRITYSSIGIATVNVKIYANSGHPWLEPEKPNAIHCAIEVLNKILNMDFSQYDKTTINVGVFNGGTILTAKAQNAEFRFEVRSVDGKALDIVLESAKNISLSLASKNNCEIEWELISKRLPCSLPKEHILITKVKEVHKSLGIASLPFPSSTNANIPLEMQIPAVTLGITKGGEIHSTKEWISKKEVNLGIKQIEYLLDELEKIISNEREGEV